MTSSKSLGSPSVSSVLFWIYTILSLFIVFYIPTLVPGTFVESDSYVFGYNNRIAFLIFVCLAAVGSIWWRKFRLDIPTPTPAGRVERKTLWIGLACGLALCCLFYFLTSSSGHYGEAAFFINRIELTARGLQPYRDFQFNYGIAFLYLPVFLSRLFHISIPNGYYLFWTLNVLAGIWMLYEVIRKLDYPSAQKNNIFVLLYLGILPGIVTTGANYTGFRFLVGPLFALIVYKTIQNGKLHTQILGSLQAVVFTSLLLLISPEVATAFCLGIATFFFLFYLRSDRWIWLVPYSLMILLMVAAMRVADGFGVFLTFKSFAGGGYSFPIVPAAHILLLFVSAYLCACYMAETWVKREFRSNSLLLLLVSLPSLAAAMGRCDPGHVLFNAIGIFLICMLRVSNNAVAWKWYRFAFVVTFIVLSAAGGLLLYSSMIGDAAAFRTKNPSRPSAATDPVLLPAHLSGPAMVPFGYYPSQNPSGLDGGYYMGLGNAVTPDAVALKISELKNNPGKELVLPKDFDNWCHTNPRVSRVLISVLFAYPYHGKAIHTKRVYEPLCEYIQQNYSMKIPPAPDTYEYGIWRPNP